MLATEPAIAEPAASSADALPLPPARPTSGALPLPSTSELSAARVSLTNLVSSAPSTTRHGSTTWLSAS